MSTALANALRDVLNDIEDEDADKVLMPVTKALLMDPKFEGFTVDVEGWTPRPWDGWFHPSTHATWTERQLFYYLTDPERISTEQMALNSVLAITQGKVFHTFFQHLWLRAGTMSRAEVSFEDPTINCRGHMDGERDNEGVEIKSINDFQIDKIVSWEILKERKPEYWSQTQDYLAMSGYLQMRYFMITTSFPYQMQEFVVPFDPEHHARQRAKYQRAMEAAKTGVVPSVCAGCVPRSKKAKGCPVRDCCEIGRVM